MRPPKKKSHIQCAGPQTLASTHTQSHSPTRPWQKCWPADEIPAPKTPAPGQKKYQKVRSPGIYQVDISPEELMLVELNFVFAISRYICIHRHTHRHTHAHRHTNTHAHTSQPARQTDRQTDTYMTYTHTHTTFVFLPPAHFFWESGAQHWGFHPALSNTFSKVSIPVHLAKKVSKTKSQHPSTFIITTHATFQNLYLSSRCCTQGALRAAPQKKKPKEDFSDFVPIEQVLYTSSPPRRTKFAARTGERERARARVKFSNFSALQYFLFKVTVYWLLRQGTPSSANCTSSS